MQRRGLCARALHLWGGLRRGASGDAATPEPDATLPDGDAGMPDGDDSGAVPEAGSADSAPGDAPFDAPPAPDGSPDASVACTSAKTLAGNFTINNELDVQTLTPYCAITGSLTINASSIAAGVSLPNLQSVGADLTATFNGNPLSLPALVKVPGYLTLEGTYSSSNFGELATVGDLSMSSTSTFTFPSLTSVIATLQVTAGGASFPVLSQAGTINVLCSSSCSVGLPNLAQASTIHVASNSVEIWLRVVDRPSA